MSILAIAIAFSIGALFGFGLLISGMTEPGNVQGFLDLAGAWRPQLLAVLGSAVVVASLMFTWARRRAAPLAARAFAWPTRKDIDARLVIGSAMFGIGWALAGYCPGPALTALGTLSTEAWVFVPALAAGAWLAQRLR